MLENVVLGGVITLEVSGVVALHLAGVHILGLHVTVAGQQTAVTLY